MTEELKQVSGETVADTSAMDSPVAPTVEGSAIEGAAGSDTLVGQAPRVINPPPAGQTDVVRLNPGEQFQLAANPATVQLVVDGDNLVMGFDLDGDGEPDSFVVLEDLVLMAGGGNPPALVVAGETIGTDLLVANAIALARVEETGAAPLETAAGPDATGGGATVYSDNLGDPINLLEALGVIPPTELEFGLIDLEDEIVLLDEEEDEVAEVAPPPPPPLPEVLDTTFSFDETPGSGLSNSTPFTGDGIVDGDEQGRGDIDGGSLAGAGFSETGSGVPNEVASNLAYVPFQDAMTSFGLDPLDGLSGSGFHQVAVTGATSAELQYTTGDPVQTAGGAQVTSQGEDVFYLVDPANPNLVLGVTGLVVFGEGEFEYDELVFAIHLDDSFTASGDNLAFTYAEYQQIDHPDSTNDDESLSLTINFDVSGSGGTTSAQVTLLVEDDAPDADGGEGGSDDMLVYDETPGLQTGEETIVALPLDLADFVQGEGLSVCGAAKDTIFFDYGMDQPVDGGEGEFVGGVSLTQADGSLYDGTQSSGLFTLDGDEIFLHSDGDNVIYGKTAGGEFIFAVYLDDTDAFSFSGPDNEASAEIWFVQFEPFFHPDGTDPNDQIDFSVFYTVTDFDQDTSTQEFTVKILDDGPSLDIYGGASVGVVEEEHLPLGNEDEDDLNTLDDDSDPDFDVTTTVATGDLSVLVDPGKDAPALFGLAEDTTPLEDQGLTSGGQALSYAFTGGGVLVGFVGAFNEEDDSNWVFTLELQEDGNWTFTLLDKLDHHAIPDADDVEDILTIDFTGMIEATDSDFDPVTLDPDSFLVKIIDDVPVANDDEDDAEVDGDPVSGNVITGIDSGDNAGAGPDDDDEADSAGADGLGVIRSITHNGVTYTLVDATTVDNDGGLTQGTEYTFDGTTLAIETAEGGSLEIDLVGSNIGNYTYDPPASVSGASEVFVYELEDGDGDADTATLTINLDDAPTAENASTLVDEDGLPAGNDDSADGDDVVPNDDGDNDESTSEGSLVYDAGANGFKSLSLDVVDGADVNISGTTTQVTSGGVGLVWKVISDEEIWAVTDDLSETAVIKVTLTNVTATGADYDVELLGPLDHSVADTEDNILIDIGYTVTDNDDDTASAVLTVDVDDDLPVVVDEETSSGTVEEEHLDGGNEDEAPAGDLDTGGDFNLTTTETTGTLSALVNFGADGPGDFALDIIPDENPIDSGLESGGETVWYVSDGTTLTAFVDDGGTANEFDGTDTVIFTLTLSGTNNEDWTFTLEGVLDHAADDAEDTLTIDFSGFVTATDNDGDSVALDAETFTVDVIDDIPILLDANSSGTVEEEHLAGGNEDEAPAEDLDAGGNFNLTTTVTNGSLSALVSFGADGPGDFALDVIPDEDPIDSGLTSGGATVWYVSDGTTLTAFVDEGDGDFGAGDTTIFTLALSGTNNEDWTFTLLGVLDHAADDAEDILTIDFSGLVTATDGDGDSVTLGDSTFTVDVIDDIPENISPDKAVIGSGAGSTFTGDLDFFDNVGADKNGDVTFASSLDGAQLLSGGTPVTSDGDNIYLQVSADGHTLIGWADVDGSGTINEGDTMVFTIVLNPDAVNEGDDEYLITLHDNIDTGAEFTFDDFSSAPAGQNEWLGLDSDGGDIDADNNDSMDLLITPTNVGGTVNTDADDMGNANQWIDTGEGLRVDFVIDVERLGALDEKDADGWTHEGHYSVNRFSFRIHEVQGSGNTAAVLVSAFLDPDGNLTVGDGVPVMLSPDEIVVRDENGVDVTASVTVWQFGDSLIVEGLEEGWQVQVISDTSFNSIEIDNADGIDGASGDSFSLSEYTLSTEAAGDPIDLSFDVDVVDEDGDTAEGTLEVTVLPQVEGTSGDDTLTAGTNGGDLVGGDGDDVLIGSDADDKLQGGAGNDTISDGAGNDLIIGGDGADVINLAADSATDVLEYNLLSEAGDTVNGFDAVDPAAGGDVIDLVDLLDGGDFTGTTLSEAVDDGYVILSDNGGNAEISVDLDGSAGGGDSPVLIATLVGIDLGSDPTALDNNIVVD